ncbi:NADH-quinone oxidoreductase subunit L [Sinosporangium album]|uniref:NADH-quinone oxidoreductase subunit L n=1 Tax=Sinosporangium album TaxID=504805 RepID=A0A1G7UF25_9ACTN|nr:NADH-quinone oxidoreductase subunit L [Sinosporangium album]SDG45881.1 NADH-quinone oxidoreductase subunit L [Sinosporangium album]
MMVMVACAVLLPFLGAVGGLLGPRAVRFAARRAAWRAVRFAAWFAVVPTAVAAILAGVAAVRVLRGGTGGTAVAGTLTVVETGSLPVAVGLEVTRLSALTGVLVTVVALAVQVYSVGYMRDDRRYPSYSAFISLFTSAMLLVVYAADLIVLYVGWEIMGLCSYLLIGHWWEDRANSRAAVKAFLVTRLGDVGFLFGIFVLAVGAGSFRIDDVVTKYPAMSTTVLTVGTLLLLVGVAGKSAQAPLHTWLPDAMAGPTPISALIHAATMVAAGIFIVARLFPLFLAAPTTLAVLAIMAALGMLGAALAALAQDDLKRVLAYSTISQLAFMAGALAARDDDAAIFHLFTHGAFKALLFLCAGLIIHRAATNLMSGMGGLRRAMPITFATTTIGFAALMGLPPASGFFSKDAALAAMGAAPGAAPGTAPGAVPSAVPSAVPGAVGWILYGTALATVAVTGAYATRAWLRTFFGEPRAQTGDHAREGPASMLWPVILLAVPALLLGFAVPAAPHWGTAALSVALALLGAGAVYATWRGAPDADPARLLGPLRRACEQAFYVDTAYNALFVRPVRWLAHAVVRADDTVVDGAVRGSGRTARGLSGVLRLAQNGNAQIYVSGLVAGLLIIVVGAVVLG